jgi:hypothetical protein
MGAASSTTTTNTIDTKAITDILNKNTVSCKTNVSLSQLIDVEGSGNILEDITQSSGLSLDASCYNQSQTINEIQSIMENSMSNKVEKIDPALLSAANTSQTELENDIKQEIRNTITTENMTNIINDVNASQTIKVRQNANILKNITQDSTLGMVASAVQDAVNSTKSVTTLTNLQKNDAKLTTTDPINDAIKGVMDGINGIFSSAATTMIFFAVILAIVIIFAGPTILSAFKALNPLSAISFGERKNKQSVPMEQYNQQYNDQLNSPYVDNQQYQQDMVPSAPEYPPMQEFSQQSQPPFNPNFNSAQPQPYMPEQQKF